ncbi:hypothetical protein Tco_0989292 [Tanacetum coccineum]|uniref:Uncharacterized protein n=1 Tax=Tanacetum coccineum TaxID=301880 RepID=A0ABQ5ET88_9ASTR
MTRSSFHVRTPPQQKWSNKKKASHIVETGLAMLFNAPGLATIGFHPIHQALLLEANATNPKPTNLGPNSIVHLCRSSDPNQAAQVHTPNPITSQHSLGIQDTISVHHSDQVHIPANDSDLVYVSDPENHPLATYIAPNQPTTGSSSSHPMTTRSKAGIFKHKHHADLASLTTHPLHVALLSTTDP